jgi:hypothetical protein
VHRRQQAAALVGQHADGGISTSVQGGEQARRGGQLTSAGASVGVQQSDSHGLQAEVESSGAVLQGAPAVHHHHHNHHHTCGGEGIGAQELVLAPELRQAYGEAVGGADVQGGGCLLEDATSRGMGQQGGPHIPYGDAQPVDGGAGQPWLHLHGEALQGLGTAAEPFTSTHSSSRHRSDSPSNGDHLAAPGRSSRFAQHGTEWLHTQQPHLQVVGQRGWGREEGPGESTDVDDVPQLSTEQSVGRKKQRGSSSAARQRVRVVAS